jgi:hypothetical protein
MESPCPQKLIVARTPEATPNCDRSTEPITAETLGAAKRAIPSPKVASAARTRQVEAENETRANCPIPAAITIIPAAARP